MAHIIEELFFVFESDVDVAYTRANRFSQKKESPHQNF